ncbi:Wza Periplasmic protein involved in polysaccharide export, contains SLBB domain of b-grasp fold [Fimbriimonadaceae bacterium]|jgi:polysaccharide biosynthesis/export protein
MKLLSSVCVLSLFAMSVVAQAQNEPAPDAATAYRFRAEDVLRVQVYGQAQLSAEMPVGDDGTITPPFVGSIMAAGRSVKELTDDLVKLYQDKVRLREPLVSISIIKYRENRATIGGFVGRPGNYQIRKGDRILNLLSVGGGPIADRSDLKRATLQRQGSRELIPIDLHAMLYRNDTSQNYELKDGDQLSIPEGLNLFIKVQGKVQAPGLYPYKEPMTLADAISQARGEVVGRSRLSKTLVIRQKPGQPGQYTYINADYVKFIRKGDITQNIELQPGDLIYVPETNTPDFQQITSLANVFFILDRVGSGLFGLQFFR